MAHSKRPGKGHPKRSTKPKTGSGTKPGARGTPRKAKIEGKVSAGKRKPPQRPTAQKTQRAPWTREDEEQARRNTDAALDETRAPEANAPGAPSTPVIPQITEGSTGTSTKAMPKNFDECMAPFKWKKGVSGNPGGRPSMKPVTDAYREIALMEIPEGSRPTLSRLCGIDLPPGTTFAQAAALNVFLVAACTTKEAARAMMEITNRVEGKVPIAITDGGKPIRVQLSAEDRKKRIAEILAKAMVKKRKR